VNADITAEDTSASDITLDCFIMTNGQGFDTGEGVATMTAEAPQATVPVSSVITQGNGALTIQAGCFLNSTGTATVNAVGESIITLASGGGIVSAQGPPGTVPTTLTPNNSEVSGNTVGGDGGGIANGIPLPRPMPLPGGALTLNSSDVTGNTPDNCAHRARSPAASANRFSPGTPPPGGGS
jgi:hypothetical protein